MVKLLQSNDDDKSIELEIKSKQIDDLKYLIASLQETRNVKWVVIISQCNEEIATECYNNYTDQREFEKDTIDDFMAFVKKFGIANYSTLAMEIAAFSGIEDDIQASEERLTALLRELGEAS
jgi:hypothetical protein